MLTDRAGTGCLLTARQKEILEFMHEHARMRFPTIREIAKHFGLYPATIQDHVDALRRKGYLPKVAK